MVFALPPNLFKRETFGDWVLLSDSAKFDFQFVDVPGELETFVVVSSVALGFVERIVCIVENAGFDEDDCV